MSNATDLAYLAGLIDGEGSFYLAAQHNGRFLRPSLAISMCDNEGLLWVHKTFPQFLFGLQRKKLTNGGKHVFRCVITKYDDLLNLLPKLLPFLKVKKEHAKILLDYINIYSQKRGGDGIYKLVDIRAWQFKERLSAINKHPITLL